MRKLIIFVMLSLIFLITNCEDSTKSNNLPDCIITKPAQSNLRFAKGDDIEIVVEADDADGSINEVRFYIDNEGLFSDSEFPYKYELETWDLSNGYHFIKAIAYDDKNDQTEDTISIFIDEPDEYDGLDKSIYQEIFIEDFNSNDKNWAEGVYDSCKISFKDGYYQIENSSKSYSRLAWQNITGLDEANNFEIEANIKTVNNNSRGGVFWGLDTDSEYFRYYLLLFQDTQFLVVDDHGTEFDWWTYPTSYGNLNSSGVYNKITIRKYQDRYYFFVNEELIDYHYFKSFYGNYAGIYISSESIVQVDYLNIYQLGNSLGKINKTTGVQSGIIRQKSKF